MRHRATRPHKILIGLAACGAIGLAACGSDGDGDSGGDGGGGGGASTEAFCDELNALAEAGPDTTEEEDFAALQAIAVTAPDEISGAMGELVDIFEQFQALDPENASEDELAGFEDLLSDLEQASADVEAFATENCPGLPADFFDEG